MNSSSLSKGSPLASPTVPEERDEDSLKDKESNNEKDTSTVGSRHVRSKKSVDAKTSDRLSIFGTTFGGTLGRSRKPPPRLDCFTVILIILFSFLVLVVLAARTL